jgi:glycosyltransferase involved in cell wall biosynthesis
MNILFIHPNFPAQFRYMAQWFGSHGHRTVFATENLRPEWVIPGVVKVAYKAKPVDTAQPTLFQPLHQAAAHAEAVLHLGRELKKRGFVPDVVCGASGWGGTWFIRDVFPQARLVGYFEWYYDPDSADSQFGIAEPLLDHRRINLRLRNTVMINDLLTCDACITPTQWQRQQFPEPFRDTLKVLHDGIDTEYFSPEPSIPLSIPNLPLTGDETIVTYATRGMEPYRGFPQFIESLPQILDELPDCHVVIAGEDRVCYGARRSDGKTWKQAMLEKIALPAERVHFIGRLPYGHYRQLLRRSTVHVYLTRPFVLSWSLLEAMSCGCAVVASDTEPVHEVIRDGENGVYADFQSPADIAQKVIEMAKRGPEAGEMRRQARETVVKNYSLSSNLPRQLQILANIGEQ